MKKGLLIGVCFLFILIVLISFASAATKQYITNDASCSSAGLFSFGILNGDIHGGSETFIGDSLASTFVDGYVTYAQDILGSSSPTMCLGSDSITLWSDEQASASDCSGSNTCRSWGALIGGYLYAGSGVSSQGILIGAYSSSREHASGYGSSIICNLWDASKGDSSYNTYLQSNNFKRLSTSSGCLTSKYNYGSVSDRSGEEDDICPATNLYGHCIAESWNLGANNLVPGVYIMAMGVRVAAPYNRGDSAEALLFPVGSFPTPNTLYRSPPYKSSTPFYVISNRMLTAQEIRDNFPNSEVETHFCEAANYDKNPTSNACCGNDASDIGKVDSGYYCDGLSWESLKNDGANCVEAYECVNSYCCDASCSDVACIAPSDCGNSIKETGEECDDGNLVNTDDCTNVCKDNICGDGYLNTPDEECDDGNLVNTDDCTNVCKDNICGDGMCGSGETCSNCFNDCGYCYEQYTTCEDCVGEAYTWCKDGDGTCVSDTGGCADKANYDYECGSECVNGIQEYSVASLSEDIEVKKLINSLESGCGLNFEFNVLDTLPRGYTFSTINRRVVKVLNITSDANVETDIDIVLNESGLGLKFPIENVAIYIEEGTGWVSPTQQGLVFPNTQSKVYTYRFRTPHFSLFLITEPDYCGNGVFDAGYEDCDGSVSGVSHCTGCVCDVGFNPDSNGSCIQSITDTSCFVVGNETCTGYTLSECNSNLVWEDKGIVVGNCSVECYPVGNMSCQGETPLRCGADYAWDFQSKINGLCDYTDYTDDSDDNGDTLNRCGNGYCNYDEDENSCPEDCAEDDGEPNWALIILVAGIAILILVIIFVLFKIFSREKRGPMPQPNRRLPPGHRPGPKRAPGRPPEVQHGQIGRPPERRVSPEGYAVRRYPPR